MNYIYDALIALFLIIDGAVLVRFILRSRNSWKFTAQRRKINLPAFALFLILLTAWFLVAYGSFIEPRRLVVTQQEIKLGSPAAGRTVAPGSAPTAATTATPASKIRAAFISDLHVGPYKKDDYVEKVVARANALKPDVIFIGGDNLYGNATEEVQYLAPLKNLRAPMGVFGILGNHDYGEGPVPFSAADESRAVAIRKTLEDAGVKMLVNDSHIIKIGARRLYLLGLDEYWTGRDDMSAAIRSLERKGIPWRSAHPNILLTHNPDEVRVADAFGIDLLLTAHTHGGQIRLPLLGPVSPIPDGLGRKYDRGLFKYGKTQMFITSGIGESGPRARLFVPPEIALLEISF